MYRIPAYPDFKPHFYYSWVGSNSSLCIPFQASSDHFMVLSPLKRASQEAWGSQSRREAGASAEAWRNPGPWTWFGPTLHLSDPVHFNSTFIQCSFINLLRKPRSREVKIFSQSSNVLMAGLGYKTGLLSLRRIQCMVYPPNPIPPTHRSPLLE